MVFVRTKDTSINSKWKKFLVATCRVRVPLMFSALYPFSKIGMSADFSSILVFFFSLFFSLLYFPRPLFDRNTRKFLDWVWDGKRRILQYEDRTNWLPKDTHSSPSFTLPFPSSPLLSLRSSNSYPFVDLPISRFLFFDRDLPRSSTELVETKKRRRLGQNRHWFEKINTI